MPRYQPNSGYMPAIRERAIDLPGPIVQGMLAPYDGGVPFMSYRLDVPDDGGGTLTVRSLGSHPSNIYCFREDGRQWFPSPRPGSWRQNDSPRGFSGRHSLRLTLDPGRCYLVIGRDRHLWDQFTLTVEGLGSGSDTGDKAVMKANTAALKYCLANGFLIS